MWVMNYEGKIEQIDNIIKSLRYFKKELNRTKKLSDKWSTMNWQTHSRKQIENNHASLNWACMNLDKQQKSVWREIKNSFLEISLEETEYNPSWFHKYKW